MKRFIGHWQNEAGNQLIIKWKNAKSATVTFISGVTDGPVGRPFKSNDITVDMDAKLDYYETGVEIDLWDKGKGFYLCLWDDDYLSEAKQLHVGISRPAETKYDILEKYYDLFGPLEPYKRRQEK